MRVLLVEDEPAIADFVRRGLEAEGYAVTWETDGAVGERVAIGEGVDLVILDRLLPGRDGLDVLGAIRHAKPQLPVIMLTARGEIEDRVEGLDLGATDYIVKPFAFAELVARVRAHLRLPNQGRTNVLEEAGVRVDLITREVEREGEAIRLSAREFDLLVYLMRHPGQVLSREQLLSGVWGYSHDPGTGVVKTYVGYLRRKLATDGAPAPIETVRSVGYRFVADRG